MNIPCLSRQGPFLPHGSCRGTDNGMHPCSPCLLGTYWQDSKTCVACPAGQTTEDHFAKDISACVRQQPSALSQFIQTKCFYLRQAIVGCKSYQGM